jgi:hypothetical protein
MNWGSNWGFTDLNRDSPFWIHQLLLELHFAAKLFIGAGQGLFSWHHGNFDQLG